MLLSPLLEIPFLKCIPKIFLSKCFQYCFVAEISTARDDFLQAILFSSSEYDLWFQRAAVPSDSEILIRSTV